MIDKEIRFSYQKSNLKKTIVITLQLSFTVSRCKILEKKFRKTLRTKYKWNQVIPTEIIPTVIIP